MNVAAKAGRADPGLLRDPGAVRRAVRAGAHRGHTSGLARGYVQGNVAILPRAFAFDFLRYCQRNPKPCPLLAVSEPGDPRLPELGQDLDIRTDVPAYDVFRDGRLAETVPDIRGLWRDDFVAFVLGCSFSFEEALLAAGLRLPYVEAGGRPWRYDTSIETAPAGPFRGGMVVTMRAFPPADAVRAIQVTSRLPSVHGAPVHIGLPHLIGIGDLVADDRNGCGPMPEGQIPLFWACGVTPQRAIENARPPIAITHKPGHMLVTDRRNASLALF